MCRIKIAIVFIVVLCIAACVATAEGEIYSKDNLSKFDIWELAALRDLCQEIIMESDSWQEVEVPQGVWWVGFQIPAGKWTVCCKTGDFCTFSWGERLRDNEKDIDPRGRCDYVIISNPASNYYEIGDITEYTFEVYMHEYIVIDNAPAVFTPYQGKPDLGFTFK